MPTTLSNETLQSIIADLRDRNTKQDYIVEGELVLADRIGTHDVWFLGSLLFAKGARIVLGQTSLTLHIADKWGPSTLDLNPTLFVAFPQENTLPKPDKPEGRPMGPSATRDGGHGAHGESGKRGEPGVNGLDAEDLIFLVNHAPTGPFLIDLAGQDGGPGGDGGDGGNGGNGKKGRDGSEGIRITTPGWPPVPVPMPYCRDDARNGGNAGNGGDGGQSGQGGEPGDGGYLGITTITSEVAQEILKLVRLSERNAVCGSPGASGEPGIRGKRGERGDRTTNCRGGKHGREGQDGVTTRPHGLPPHAEGRPARMKVQSIQF